MQQPLPFASNSNQQRGQSSSSSSSSSSSNSASNNNSNSNRGGPQQQSLFSAWGAGPASSSSSSSSSSAGDSKDAKSANDDDDGEFQLAVVDVELLAETGQPPVEFVQKLSDSDIEAICESYNNKGNRCGFLLLARSSFVLIPCSVAVDPRTIGTWVYPSSLVRLSIAQRIHCFVSLRSACRSIESISTISRAPACSTTRSSRCQPVSVRCLPLRFDLSEPNCCGAQARR